MGVCRCGNDIIEGKGVPEPGSVALMGLAMTGFLMVGRLRRRQARIRS